MYEESKQGFESDKEGKAYIWTLASAYSAFRDLPITSPQLYLFREVPDLPTIGRSPPKVDLFTGGENNIRWVTGEPPCDGPCDDSCGTTWKMLSDHNLTTIINFSNVYLEMTPGFEIINFLPEMGSLCAPMTDSEERLVQDFLSIIKMAVSTKRLYVCGNQLDRLSLCAILLSRVGVEMDIKGQSVTDVHKMLVEKFSQV
jgi:hypothetical protein